MKHKSVNAALVTQTSFTYTSTRSTFVFNVADTVDLTVEFLSPVLPNNTQQMSLPITYMNVGVVATDGKKHAYVAIHDQIMTTEADLIKCLRLH